MCNHHVVNPKSKIAPWQLIDRGKVDAKDVALEIGISPDTLNANINVML